MSKILNPNFQQYKWYHARLNDVAVRADNSWKYYKIIRPLREFANFIPCAGRTGKSNERVITTITSLEPRAHAYIYSHIFSLRAHIAIIIVFVRFVALIKLPLAGKLAAAGNRNARPFSCNSLTGAHGRWNYMLLECIRVRVWVTFIQIIICTRTLQRQIILTADKTRERLLYMIDCYNRYLNTLRGLLLLPSKTFH